LIYLLKPTAGSSVQHELLSGRGLWLHIAKGAVTVNGIQLLAGDAVSLEEPGVLTITADQENTEAILFDLK